jgi:metallophosphoesterase (TIGR03767 family)
MTARAAQPDPATTVQRRLVPGEPGDGGYRALVAADGEPHAVRADLASAGLRAGWLRSATPVLCLAHLSDTHIMDHQSPGRAELFDRFSDPDSPLRTVVGIIGSYRAQELFTFQVADAMIRAVRKTGRGPVAGVPVDFAIVTGDATDNCQLNELRSYIAVLDGEDVVPDSGDLSRYEGIAGAEVADEHYWHPEHDIGDLPRRQYGFPAVPGVLAAARRPFRAAGLGLPWYAVHGNHDNLLQGTVPPAGWLARIQTGGVKYVTPPEDLDALGALARFDTADAKALAELPDSTRITVTPDPSRTPVTRSAHVKEHFRSPGAPTGHGYTLQNLADGTAYYGFDHGLARCIVLDTVNPYGGWQGSLDETQLGWLRAELTACEQQGRPVLLFSHHPVETMVNDRRPPGAGRRVLGGELRAFLLGFGCVVAWINGHTHEHAVTPVREDGLPGGFWQITTASHIDWPQQARVIEVLRTGDGDVLAIACTVIDSDAPVSHGDLSEPDAMAGLARELAANDWQVRDSITAEGGAGAGAPADRNVILLVDWPGPAT